MPIEMKVEFDGETHVIEFEHSLRNMSKWESRTRKAFLGSTQKTANEMVAYYADMIITPGVDKNLVYALSPQQMEALTDYINSDQTASKVPQETKSQYNPEVTTSELVYYWLSGLKLNWEAQDWHLSRCMMLIQITSYKQQPPKKRNAREVMSDWAAENERRLKMFKTSG